MSLGPVRGIPYKVYRWKLPQNRTLWILRCFRSGAFVRFVAVCLDLLEPDCFYKKWSVLASSLLHGAVVLVVTYGFVLTTV